MRARTKTALVGLIALPLLLGGASAAAANQPPAAAEIPQLTRTVVMTGLQEPWDIAFTPDGAMLFTEKCRGLSARLADGRTVRLFGTRGSPSAVFSARSERSALRRGLSDSQATRTLLYWHQPA